jgi:hypothetical protein
MKKLILAAAVVALTTTGAFAHSSHGSFSCCNNNYASVKAGWGGTAFVAQGGLFNNNTAYVSSFGDGSNVILIQN